MQTFDPDSTPVSTRLFGLDEARYFIGGYANSTFPTGKSFKDFVLDPQLDNVILTEGETDYASIRDEMLRNAERNIFLSVSSYRRGVDLLSAGSASWAHVTFYYASYYAASAFMGIFGGVVEADKRVIAVTVGKPGSQKLVSYKWVDHPYRGRSHRAFWNAFYALTAPLKSRFPVTGRHPLEPFNSQETWQTDRRNAINYDSRRALDLTLAFESSFNPTNFPGSVPGDLGIQVDLTRSMIELTLNAAKSLALSTNFAQGLQSGHTLLEVLSAYVENPTVHFPFSRALFAPVTGARPTLRLA